MRPFDGPAAGPADGKLGVIIAERTANEVVGEQMGVAVAAALAGDQPVDRGKVTA
jgi:hypothetical protein